jgi:pyruvate kinase
MPNNASISTSFRPPLTKILATLGPACDSDKMLGKLIAAGATSFRLNFSHGTFEDHLERLERVRRMSDEMGLPIAVLGDLPGPKIRVNFVAEEGIELEMGQDVIIDPRIEMASLDHGRALIGCNYERIGSEVLGGQRVLINDGHIRMLAVENDGNRVLCRVTTGGLVTSRKGINLPDSELTVPALTEKDLACLEWAVEHELDYLALSFVRTRDEIDDLRRRLSRMCVGGVCGTGLDIADNESRIPIVAKIETPHAVKNIEEIVQASDALMVARGDLGVEMDVAHVPMIQKMLIDKAHDFGLPCIVATQMLESMISSATPTRAEVSDVANATLDGADCMMLSGETAVGKHPDLAVDTMRRVIVATEETTRKEVSVPKPPKGLRERRDLAAALSHGAWHMVRDVDAEVIIVWSEDGAIARYLSRDELRVPIIGFSSDIRAVRRMCLLFGVMPVYCDQVPEHRSEFGELALQQALDMRLASPGAPIVLIGGKPLTDPRETNTVAIRFISKDAQAGQSLERPNHVLAAR